MNHVNIHEDIVSELVAGCSWDILGYKPEIEKLDEATKPEAPKQEIAEEVNEQANTCPLCKSELNEEISDEKLSEHVEMVLSMTQQIFESLEKEEGADSIDEQEDEEDEAMASEG